MARNVRDLMTPGPASVEPSTPVVEAARLLGREDVGSLPVVEGGRLVGIVTDRDIALRVVAEGKDPGSTSIGEVCSRDLVSARPEQELDEALALMARRQVRRLPVVEEGDRLVGILAQADVALEGDDEQAGDVVEKISKP